MVERPINTYNEAILVIVNMLSPIVYITKQLVLGANIKDESILISISTISNSVENMLEIREQKKVNIKNVDKKNIQIIAVEAINTAKKISVIIPSLDKPFFSFRTTPRDLHILSASIFIQIFNVVKLILDMYIKLFGKNIPKNFINARNILKRKNSNINAVLKAIED